MAILQSTIILQRSCKIIEIQVGAQQLKCMTSLRTPRTACFIFSSITLLQTNVEDDEETFLA